MSKTFFLACSILLLAAAIITAQKLSRANLWEENKMHANAAVAPYYLVPANNASRPDGAKGPNIEFRLGIPYLPDASTGRWTIVKNPRDSFHVYAPGLSRDKNDIDCGKRATVTDQAKANGCIVATNTGPFSYAKTAKCEGPLVSDGRVVTAGVDKPTGAACIGLMKEGNQFVVGDGTAIHHRFIEHGNQLQQLSCGFGWLVANGTVMTSDSTLIAPRTVIGIDQQGNLVLFFAEGSEVAKTGVTLNQTAVWMKEIGLQYAVNYDGGGSSTLYFAPNGGSQGCPTGIDIPTCVERQVAATSCVY